VETSPGVWRAKTRVDGRPVSKVFHGNREQAHALQHAWLALVEGREPNPVDWFLRPSVGKAKPALTVGEYLGQWVERTEANIARSTLRHRRTHVEKITEKLGGIALAKLSIGDCADFYIGLARDGLRKGTAGQVRTAFVTALNDAVGREMIPRNVASIARLPKPYPVAAAPRPADPTSEQVTAMLKLADASNPKWATMACVYASTGQRNSEIRGLLWTSLDLDAGTMLIDASLTEGADATRKGTKAHRSNTVILGPFLVARLRAHLETTSGTGYVFTHKDDGVRPYALSTVVRQIKSYEQQVPGWPNGSAPIHGLRHALASQAIANGEDPASVADRLGDTVETVMRTYVQATPARREALAQATDYVI